jgi:hypothetical protein
MDDPPSSPAQITQIFPFPLWHSLGIKTFKNQKFKDSKKEIEEAL